MRLYFKYLSIHFRCQMEYKKSFILLCIGQFFIPFTVFAGLYFMFSAFGQLEGWSLFEVTLCFAVIHQAFSLSEFFARGFDDFASLVIRGDFDRLLVRPRHTVLQVLGSKFEFTRIGRLFQSIIVLIWSIIELPQLWSIHAILIIIFMIINGVFVFTGIFIMTATICFWTVQSLELANILTDGGREMAQYPLNIYEKWVTRFFTFIIPFGAVTYIPLQIILGKSDSPLWQAYVIPFAGVAFIIPALIIWSWGVRKYCSTGS